MASDFEFYGEEADQDTEQVVRGITDKVSDYTFTDMGYPCIIFKDGFTCPKHQLKVVSNMVKSNSADKDVNLYLITKGELFKMGMLSGIQISAFLEVIGCDKLTGFLDKKIRLENDRLYTLCTAY